MENQGTNEDDSQSDPHPEAGIFRSQITQNSGPEVPRDMLTGVQREIPYGHDMVTGATEETHVARDMVTAVQEKIPYCSSGFSSGKQKKARSTSQPQFRSESTPATIETDQILLAFQQLATNSNSANVNNNSNRISKLPKSLTTTMPTFDGKSEKFELFENLFQTSVKIHNQLTEENKNDYFHSLMRGDALQTFRNITSPNDSQSDPHLEAGIFRSQITQNFGPEVPRDSRTSSFATWWAGKRACQKHKYQKAESRVFLSSSIVLHWMKKEVNQQKTNFTFKFVLL